MGAYQLDDGSCLPVAERVRVLDRYYQIANAERIGSGLELAIVQTIANQHGLVRSTAIYAASVLTAAHMSPVATTVSTNEKPI